MADSLTSMYQHSVLAQHLADQRGVLLPYVQHKRQGREQFCPVSVVRFDK